MVVRELSTAPSLPALYIKALLPHSGESLPDSEYVRSGVQVEPARLAAYNQVCGFRLTDELPVTYPHLLMFPLQMALMTEKTFPFPLLGMVQIELARRSNPGKVVRSFEFRALAPVYAGASFSVQARREADGGVATWIADHTGGLAQQGRVVFQ